MATRAQKTKVGMFVTGCVLLIGGALLLISGYKHEERTPYWVEFEESVLGLGAGGLVEYMGVPVGTVKDIYVTEQNKAHVEILITKGKVALRKGVTAQLVLYSLATGTMCISLGGSDPNQPLLEAHAQIPSTKSLVKAVSSQVETLLGDLSGITQTIKSGLVGVEEGDLALVIEDADALLTRGQQFLDEANKTVSSVRGQAEKGLDTFHQLTLDVQTLVRDTDQAVKMATKKIQSLQVDKTEQNVNEVLDSISALANQLQESAKAVDMVSKTALHNVDNVEYNLRDTLRTLNDSLESMRELTQYLRHDPSALIRGKGQPVGGKK